MSNANYILNSFKYYDKKKGLVRYKSHRMKQLCDREEGEYYVSPFIKINEKPEDKEYIYNTFSKTGKPIQTCGIKLNLHQHEQLIKL